ncbi:MAG TPA: dockerin type I repeat-containing protein [Acetivibrio sp.]|nr:dockerin type I repeat-containing protein [Acetivibrio sp.]
MIDSRPASIKKQKAKEKGRRMCMNKKIVLLTVALSIAMMVLGGSMIVYASHQCNQTVIIGDVNLDGLIDALDVTILGRYVNHGQPFTSLLQFVAADVDYDGSITVQDYNMLRDYILRNISSFPAGQFYTVYYGDLNGDQLVTLDDKEIVIDHILNRTPLTFRQLAAADVDGDQFINALDVSYINSHAKDKIEHFLVCPQN